MTTTGEHVHCFCTVNAGGATCCCRCRIPMASTPRLQEKLANIYQWVDKRLFFVNNGTEHD